MGLKNTVSFKVGSMHKQITYILLLTFLFVPYVNAAKKPDKSISCGSVDGQENRCAGDFPDDTVQLLIQYSHTPCIKGRTWDYSGNLLWVAEGCAGRFGPLAKSRRKTRVRNGQFSCKSSARKHGYCEVEISRAGVILIDERSKKVDCEEGKNWGWEPQGVWVSDGCSATFELAGTSPAGSSRDSRDSRDSREYEDDEHSESSNELFQLPEIPQLPTLPTVPKLPKLPNF